MRPNRLPRELTWSDAFWFPVSTPEARRDIVTGGVLVLLLLIFGWLLNLGNRLEVVARLYRGEEPIFRGFSPWVHTFRRGCVSFLAITLYLSPSAILAAVAVGIEFGGLELAHWPFAVGSALAFGLAIFTLPGGMTVYACESDLTVLRDPRRAFQRAWTRRVAYFKAWRIAILSVALSSLGLLFFGVGFAFTSVWCWKVVGYAFTVAMYMDATGDETHR